MDGNFCMPLTTTTDPINLHMAVLSNLDCNVCLRKGIVAAVRKALDLMVHIKRCGM